MQSCKITAIERTRQRNCQKEFIQKINWLERKAPCFRAQGLTFRANKEVNYIIKIYEKYSGGSFHLAFPLLIPS